MDSSLLGGRVSVSTTAVAGAFAETRRSFPAQEVHRRPTARQREVHRVDGGDGDETLYSARSEALTAPFFGLRIPCSQLHTFLLKNLRANLGAAMPAPVMKSFLGSRKS